MTLLLTNQEDLYQFENIEDTIFWMERNPTDEPRLVVITGEEEEEFEYYLEAYFPLEIELI